MRESGRAARTLRAGRAVDGARWLPRTGGLLTSGDDVVLWDASDGRRLLTVPGAATGCAVSPGGDWIAVPGDDDTVTVFDTATGARICGVDPGAPIAACVAGPDWFAVVGFDLLARTYTAADAAPLAVIGAAGTGLAVHGTRLLTHGPDGVALDDPRGDGRRHRHGHGRLVGHWAAGGRTAAGSWLATVDEHGTLRLRDTETAAIRAEWTAGRLALAAPDGSWLATAEPHGLTVRDTGSGLIRGVLDGHADEVTDAVADLDGHRIATTDGAGVRLWCRDTWRPGRPLPHVGRVASMMFAPSPTWLATVDDEGTWVWDTADGGLKGAVPDATVLATAGGAPSVMKSAHGDGDLFCLDRRDLRTVGLWRLRDVRAANRRRPPALTPR